MKKLVYTISIVFFAWSAFAQDLTDALRYSNYHMSGTARSQAMGNAFGALGGDFTSLSINPAGAAVYRSSEFTFTTSAGNTKTDGNYLGKSSSDSQYNISINNIGYVATIPTGANSETGLVSLSFGMGFNRLASFAGSSIAEGTNMNSSLLKYFTYNANNPLTQSDNLNSYYERLAYDTYVMPFDDQNNEYFNDLTDSGYGQSVRKSTQQEGHINEYLLSFAANFNHKFYLGGTLGIHDVYYRQDANIYEFDAKNNIPYFDEFNFGTTLTTSGYGFNFKIGAIYKPTTNLRLGFALHTPTFYNLNDYYNSNMNSTLTYPDGATEYTPAKPDKGGVYDYNIQTPLKLILSGAYVIGKVGLISVDYEIVDYSTSKISHGSDGYNFYDQNAEIKKTYKTTGNLHIGGEYRLDKNFSIRAGYELYQNAFSTSYLTDKQQNSDKPFSTYSGGFGYKQGNLFLDATYQHVTGQQSMKLYPDINANEMVQYDIKQNNFIFTLGYKF
jgi:hypothetical protein